MLLLFDVDLKYAVLLLKMPTNARRHGIVQVMRKMQSVSAWSMRNGTSRMLVGPPATKLI
jgi:hypothetical protein